MKRDLDDVLDVLSEYRATLATPDPRAERLEAALTPEAFAKALTRIRGAHNNADYETEEGEPCGWCRLAGEQAAEAARALLRSPQERSGE